jgi:hypothetical protein
MKKTRIRAWLSITLLLSVLLNLTTLTTLAQQRRPRRAGEAAAEALSAGARVLPRSYVLVLRMESPLNSSTARPSDRFVARTDEPVTDEAGTMVLPANLIVIGHVTRVEAAQIGRRSGIMEIGFDRLIMPDGRELPIKGILTSADPAERKKLRVDEEGVIEGGGQVQRSIVFIGGGTTAGAMIGAIAGGAALGAGVGAAAGVVAALLAKGKEAVVDSGTLIGLELSEPLDLTQRGVMPPPRPTTSVPAPNTTPMETQAPTSSNTLPPSNDTQQPIPVPIPTAEPQLLKVSFAQVERVSGGSVLVVATAETPSGGWRVKAEHTINQSVLEVWIKGTPPEGRAAKVTSHPTVTTTVADPNRAIRRVVIHGTNGDRTVILPPQTQR